MLTHLETLPFHARLFVPVLLCLCSSIAYSAAWPQTHPRISVHSQAELDAVARELNERPRKTLDYETSAERFSQCVAVTS